VFPRRFRVPLTRFLPGEDPDAIVHTRPAPGVWSALEYAAHTRDAFEFYNRRIERVLTEDRPHLGAFDFDAACERGRYDEEDPVQVVDTLAAAAGALTERVANLGSGDWERIGIGNDGDKRTVLVLVRRAVHEGQHHLLDIGRVLRHARGRA
jgi:hypothetical protein